MQAIGLFNAALDVEDRLAAKGKKVVGVPAFAVALGIGQADLDNKETDKLLSRVLESLKKSGSDGQDLIPHLTRVPAEDMEATKRNLWLDYYSKPWAKALMLARLAASFSRIGLAENGVQELFTSSLNSLARVRYSGLRASSLSDIADKIAEANLKKEVTAKLFRTVYVVIQGNFFSFSMSDELQVLEVLPAKMAKAGLSLETIASRMGIVKNNSFNSLLKAKAFLRVAQVLEKQGADKKEVKEAQNLAAQAAISYYDKASVDSELAKLKFDVSGEIPGEKEDPLVAKQELQQKIAKALKDEDSFSKHWQLRTSAYEMTRLGFGQEAKEAFQESLRLTRFLSAERSRAAQRDIASKMVRASLYSQALTALHQSGLPNDRSLTDDFRNAELRSFVLAMYRQGLSEDKVKVLLAKARLIEI